VFEAIRQHWQRDEGSEAPAVRQAQEQLARLRQAEARLQTDLATEEQRYAEASERLTGWTIAAAMDGIEHTAEAETAELASLQVRIQSLRLALHEVEGQVKNAEAQLERAEVMARIDAAVALSETLKADVAQLDTVSRPLREHIEAMARRVGAFREARQELGREVSRLGLQLPALMDSSQPWAAVEQLLASLQRAYQHGLSDGERRR